MEPANWTPANDVGVTDASFDTAILPFANEFFLGDYVGFADGTDFLPFYAESGRTGPSRSGNWTRAALP